MGFGNGPESFDAFRLGQIEAVPEPSALGLGQLGGLTLFTGASRRARS